MAAPAGAGGETGVFAGGTGEGTLTVQNIGKSAAGGPCHNDVRRVLVVRGLIHKVMAVSSARRFSPDNGQQRISRRMSLELKLPLLMTIVLAAVLATSLIVTVTTLRRAAHLAARDRLTRAV